MKLICSNVHALSLTFLRMSMKLSYCFFVLSSFRDFLGSLVWRRRCVWIRGGTIVSFRCGALHHPGGFLGNVFSLLFAVLLVVCVLVYMLLHTLGRVLISEYLSTSNSVFMVYISSTWLFSQSCPIVSSWQLPVDSDWRESPSFWWYCSHTSLEVIPCCVVVCCDCVLLS